MLRPLPELSRAGHRMWQVQGRAAAQAVAVAPLLHLGVVAVAGVLLTRDRLSVGTSSRPRGTRCSRRASASWSAATRGPGPGPGGGRRLGEVRAEPATGLRRVRRLPTGPAGWSCAA
ncbi:ABC transporter ATP-binding protein [Streptomyces purpurascens]